MASQPPPVDQRRAGALREAILAAAADMVSEWGGAAEEGGFGRALAEIAGRLAEHSTTRLDRTPLRDQLALYDALDIARLPQRPAAAPLVFTLSDKREADVFAPALAQVTAAGDQEDIFFETVEAATFTPARLTALIAADPAADRIERAPAAVIGDPEEARPPAEYRAAAAAAPGGTLVQLDRITDLAEGDLLRIGEGAYHIAGFDGDRVLLAEALEALVQAGDRITRIDALETFASRDLQEHALYLGHPDLLLLEGKARIFVAMQPAGVVQRLRQLDPAVEIWGIDKDQGHEEPRWEKLEVVATAGGTLSLEKAWNGPVEELEIDGRKSRWLRLRLTAPLDPATAPDTTIDRLELSVTTPAPALAPGTERIGSTTLEAALYNSLPLPLTGAFLPLGPEPQRFDTFAVAAPEAFSKPGATVALDIVLSDASPQAFAATAGAGDVVYAIGRNGRLQVMRVTPDGAVEWRQLDPPEAEEGQGEVRLDHRRGLGAFELLPGVIGGHAGARHLVLAGDSGGRLYLGTVDLGPSDTIAWTLLSAPAASPVRAALLVPAPNPFRLRVIAEDEDTIHVRNVGFTGVPSSVWMDAANNPAPPAGATIRLLPGGPGAGSEQLFALVAEDGSLFTASCSLAGDVTLTDLAAAGVPRVSAGAAAAFARNNICIVAGYESNTGLFLADDNGVFESQAVPPIIGEVQRVMVQPSLVDVDSPQPVVVATGEGGALLWTHPGRIARLPWPADVNGAGAPAAVLSVDATGLAVLLVDAGDESVLALPLDRTEVSRTAQRFHAVAIPGAVPNADFLRLAGTGGAALLPLPTDVIDFGAVQRLAVPLSTPVQGGNAFHLLRTVQGNFTGTLLDQAAGEFALEAGEADTVQGSWLAIGGEAFRVTAINEPVPDDRRAILDPRPPGANGDVLGYDVLEQQASGTVASADVGTLARLDGEPPERVAHVTFDAVPGTSVAAELPAAQPVGEHWLRLASVPGGAPGSGAVTLAGEFELRRYRASSLPRSSDNPELSWEYFDGAGWQRLQVRDATRNLARSEKVAFEVPGDLSPTELAGQENHWIRARLVGGDYGQARYILDTSVPNQQSITIDRSHLNPPEIVAIDAVVEAMPALPAEAVLSDNCLQLADQSQAARTPGASFPAFEGIDAHVGSAAPTGRSLYLCFGKPLTANQLTLFAAAAEGEEGRELKAEVLGDLAWRELEVIDRSEGLTRPGIVKLFLSARPVRRTLFGQTGWWLRLAIPEPAGWSARIAMLLPNAVEARQTRAFRQEILGSSNGEPGQRFALLETPVLPGSIDLRVRETLSAEEAQALRSAAGDPDEVVKYPNVAGEWVRWRQVETFAGTDGADRVFRLVATPEVAQTRGQRLAVPGASEVVFGNARRGRIPPAGPDSIRAAFYQTGGGSTGNVAAFAVRNLKSALPAIDKVINPIAAGGGADFPPPESLALTAPVRLRHGGEALSPADVEAIVTAGDPEIARARCLASPGGAIEIVVAVRLHGLRQAPLSFARREGIAELVAEHGWGALSPRQVIVRGPDFVPLAVRVHVVARSEDKVAELAMKLRERLELLFDPVRGGPDSTGWPFGARPWTSHVQRAIDEFEAVALTREIAIETPDPRYPIEALPPTALVSADPDAITLVVDPPEPLA